MVNFTSYLARPTTKGLGDLMPWMTIVSCILLVRDRLTGASPSVCRSCAIGQQIGSLWLHGARCGTNALYRLWCRMIVHGEQFINGRLGIMGLPRQACNATVTL